MNKRSGFTLNEAVVGIFILLFAFVLIHLSLNRISKIASRVVCGTNLKVLGTAMTVYSYDYDDKFPKLGFGPWSKELGYSFDDADFKAYEYKGPCTITSSLYLLVRETGLSPRTFICPQQPEDIEFDGRNSKNLDMEELWDFGPDPYKHVSYAYQNPYSRFAADGARSAAFAVGADMSPWFKNGDVLNPNSDTKLPPQTIKFNDMKTLEKGNSLNHTEYVNDLWFFQIKRNKDCGLGQNIVFADGHCRYEKQPNVGVKNKHLHLLVWVCV